MVSSKRETCFLASGRTFQTESVIDSCPMWRMPNDEFFFSCKGGECHIT